MYFDFTRNIKTCVRYDSQNFQTNFKKHACKTFETSELFLTKTKSNNHRMQTVTKIRGFLTISHTWQTLQLRTTVKRLPRLGCPKRQPFFPPFFFSLTAKRNLPFTRQRTRVLRRFTRLKVHEVRPAIRQTHTSKCSKTTCAF